MAARALKKPRPQAATAAHDEFAIDVVAGLSPPQKSLPCRYFYDARGSELFEEITRLPEYYPTRVETAILEAHADDIAAHISKRHILVEFGSGSSVKTEIVLAALPSLRAYVPIDVSKTALDQAAARLRVRFPKLDVRPLLGDFSTALEIPSDLGGLARMGFFPGSTIGNLARDEAGQLLVEMRRFLGQDGQLIVGVDLKKDARRLVRAYNDAAGVTAAFNLNLLARINREIEPAFDVSTFRHEARFDPVEGRIEMHLVSLVPQTVRLLGRQFRFREGETIHTENSYKYTVAEFQSLARASGWRPATVWTDPAGEFSVHDLRAS